MNGARTRTLKEMSKYVRCDLGMALKMQVKRESISTWFIQLDTYYNSFMRRNVEETVVVGTIVAEKGKIRKVKVLGLYGNG